MFILEFVQFAEKKLKDKGEQNEKRKYLPVKKVRE